jgi:hypothetical protein
MPLDPCNIIRIHTQTHTLSRARLLIRCQCRSYLPQALPFAGGTLDLVVSNLCLHWINDVPGASPCLSHYPTTFSSLHR